MSHVTHIRMSHVTYKQVRSRMHVCTSFALGAYRQVSIKCEWVTSRMHASCHVCMCACHLRGTIIGKSPSNVNESRHMWTSHVTYECVCVVHLRSTSIGECMSHITYESVILRMNKSCHICIMCARHSHWTIIGKFLSNGNASRHIYMSHVTHECVQILALGTHRQVSIKCEWVHVTCAWIMSRMNACTWVVCVWQSHPSVCYESFISAWHDSFVWGTSELVCDVRIHSCAFIHMHSFVSMHSFR